MADIPLPPQSLRHLESQVPNAPEPESAAVLNVNNFVSDVLTAQGQSVLDNITESPQAFLDSICAPPGDFQSHEQIYGVSSMYLVGEDEQVCEVYDLEVVDDTSFQVNSPDDFLNPIDKTNDNVISDVYNVVGGPSQAAGGASSVDAGGNGPV